MEEYQREEIRKAGGDPEVEESKGSNSANCGVKRPFSIDEAWRRVKSFMQSDDSSTDKKKEKETKKKKKSEN